MPIFLAKSAVTVFLVAIFFMAVLEQTAGDMEQVLQQCCQTGENWARNHTSCTGPIQNTNNMPSKDRLTCLTSLYVCCIRAQRRISCERGKEAAKEARPCGSSDDMFRDCCDGCTLGIQAGIMRMPCEFQRFSFGAPWDEAYIDCCEKHSSGRDTSRQTDKLICEPNRPCTQKCDIVENSIKCSCHVGFKLARDQATCEDLDECSTGTHTCNPVTEICINLVGGFECQQHPVQDPIRPNKCPAGYAMNPSTRRCDDIDECMQRPCPPDKLCVNSIGSFSCESSDTACSQGFIYNERTGFCIDVDECGESKDNCDRSTQICQNSHGSFQCIPKPSRSKNCPAGFKWSDKINNCEDFDECNEGLHDCELDKDCRNTVGGYECEPKCPLTMTFDTQQNKCVENKVCGLHDCKADEVCIATTESDEGFLCVPRSADSLCPPGFKPGSESSFLYCEDINECEEYPDICEPGQGTCINEVGSYNCITDSLDCPPGFRMDISTTKCIDIDECVEKLDTCNRTTHDCVNQNGTHICAAKVASLTCPPGFRVNSRSNSCEDVDECAEGRHKCLQDKEQCENVPGAYKCAPIKQTLRCPPGHRFEPTTGGCRDVDECVENTNSCNPITQNCINAVGSYRCVARTSCPHGYRWSGNKCEDINECQERTDNCERRTEICVNTDGNFQCQRDPRFLTKCGSGYVYDAALDTCADLNECEILRPCVGEQICQNTIGSYSCMCPQGYTMDPVTRQCNDVNECQLGFYSCAESQRCDNTVGSYICHRTTSCGTGYTLNAGIGQCEDDDECVLKTHNCGPGFSCRNIQGSFRCDRVTCPPGQKLLTDGTCKVVVCNKGMEPDDIGNCIDINECTRQSACRQNQRCINTLGSYTCQNLLNCPAGYEINEFGSQCVDIDECARRLYDCGPEQTCRNRPGGYSCECPRGYTLNLQLQCEDIDECTRFRGQVCSRVSECINTQGSYVCNCKDGFRKGDDDKTCDDIDECVENPNICQQVCNNVWGSYQCSCRPGFKLAADNRSCNDIDECKTYEGHGELCIGYCVNEPGSFSCSCPSGYRLSSDKRTCQDIDECLEQNVCNADKEMCLNTRGSYKCNRIACPPNYVRDKDHRNRCKKAVQDCRYDDSECINEPKSISYNYITFVSNIRIPFSGQLDLFTMRGPRMTVTTVQFNLELKDARTRSGVPTATREYFHLRRTAYNEAMVSLIKSIQGPQEIELDLILKMFHNGKFAGNAIAKIFIFVTEHKF